jgi:hypothetical protein
MIITSWCSCACFGTAGNALKDRALNQERVVDEWSIPDDLWEAIAPLIPKRVNTHPFGGGKPPTPDRVCMEAIL